MGRKKGFHLAQEQKDFLSKFWKGKRMGDDNPAKRPEVREKIKLSWIKIRESGWINPLKGGHRTEETKKRISIKNSNEGNGTWQGDDVSYGALHTWIKRHKPNPELCEECKINSPYELSNISGEYKRDINDFRWLCRGCHRKYDYKFNGKWNFEKIDELTKIQGNYK